MLKAFRHISLYPTKQSNYFGIHFFLKVSLFSYRDNSENWGVEIKKNIIIYYFNFETFQINFNFFVNLTLHSGLESKKPDHKSTIITQFGNEWFRDRWWRIWYQVFEKQNGGSKIADDSEKCNWFSPNIVYGGFRGHWLRIWYQIFKKQNGGYKMANHFPKNLVEYYYYW